ncbi:MAG: sigma-54-dependent Fis family transcriptional regulator [Planctomycetaceae bacterium]|nr:sigma-54-dependent Fis family transcriptional regulator [Planctomycetaceae bacterium]
MTKPPYELLVVEDGDSERESLVRALKLEGFKVSSARNPADAMRHIGSAIDLVISDLRMGNETGIDLLRRWREQHPFTPFIILTAYGAVDSAVTAMKLGANDFLTKPVDPEQLLLLVNNLLAARETLPVPASPGTGFDKIIGRSQAMSQICEQTARAARTDSTVLVLGESGTGKELIAEAIHKNSPRAGGPFVVVNIAAIPDTLVESELFGHVKGAFTHAVASRMGRFELAQGGTLFIDEIGDFPLHLQPKLLRVLEGRTITPVGGNLEISVDVRVVAATSRPLVKMKNEGQFREDLYYRLNVISIALPPLRQRRTDIPLLVRHFLGQFAALNRTRPLNVEPSLMHELENLPWPGNVRQLRNTLERMSVMARQESLTLEDLPADVREQEEESTATLDAPLESIKRAAMVRALEQFDGNRTKAAEFLGISVRTLQRKLRDWGWN